MDDALVSDCWFSYLSEMHLVEDDLVRVVDAPEPRYEGQDSNDGDSDLVVPFSTLRRLEFPLDLGGNIIHLLNDSVRVRRGGSLLVLGAAMPHASWGGHGGL